MVFLILVLQICLFRFHLARFTPDNPRSLKYRMKKFFTSLGLLSFSLLTLSVASPQALAVDTTPQILIYEGELLDDLGVPLAGSFTFRFSFWDNADFEVSDVAGGVVNVAAPDYLGWTSVLTSSLDADGAFSFQLGEDDAFVPGMFDRDNLFLQVEVKLAADPDINYEFIDIDPADPTDDRKVIASVPFAFNANKLDYRDLGFGNGEIPFLDDATGLLPSSVLPQLQASNLDLADITLADFTNDLALPDSQILVGDATGVAAGVDVTGDVTLDNTGAFTIADDAVDGTDIAVAGEAAGSLLYSDGTDWINLGIGTAGQMLQVNGTADAPEWADAPADNLTNLTDTNITGPAAGNVLVYDGVNSEWDNVAVTGDATLSEMGVFALADDSIGEDEIDFANVTLADFTNDAGFLTAETQDLSLVGSDLSITGGSTIDLSSLSGAVITTGVNGNSFTLDLDGDAALADSLSIEFGDTIGETLTWDGADDRFELSDDLLIGGNLNTLGTINGVTVGLKSVTRVLSPRYPHSIFEADGTNNTGSMYEEEDTLVSGVVNTILRWFSRQPVLNDYDVVVLFTIPDNFEDFQTPALALDYMTEGLATDAEIDLTVERNNDGADELSGTGLDLNSNAWVNDTFALDAGTTWSAGDTMKIRLAMRSRAEFDSRIGNIAINYIEN